MTTDQMKKKFNVLLQNKSEQKVTCNWFCAPIIFKNTLKTGFSIRDICTITICVGPVLTVIRYLLFEKHAFNGLLNVIGIQNK